MPEKMRDLTEMARIASEERGLDDEVQLDDMQAEVAIGTADKIVRQMTLKMSGRGTQNPEDEFFLTFTMSMWDINSPDIVIKAPEGVKPFAFPTPSEED